MPTMILFKGAFDGNEDERMDEVHDVVDEEDVMDEMDKSSLE